jgi:hypothetical protein
VRRPVKLGLKVKKMSKTTDVTAWISHFGTRKLRVDEATAELERAQRFFLESRCAAGKDDLGEIGLGRRGNT